MRRIRHIYGQTKNCGVTSILAPNESGEWIELTARTDMEAAIMEENESKYHQTQDTPFMQAPLLQDFGYLGLGPHADAVIQGTYHPHPDVDPYTKKFIAHLTAEPVIRSSSPVPVFYTTNEWQAGWRKSKERTSAGSDYLHFGHFKAGCTNDIIANFEATMANIPLLSGYSPSRWRRAIDCMLLKWDGDYKVTSLRTIALLDPEANHNFKILGRAVMHHAESHHQLADEQYGSRKKKTAILHALNKCLTYDMLRQTKTASTL